MLITEAREVAEKELGITEKVSGICYRVCPEIDGWYFWNPMHIEFAMLIDDEGEKLVSKTRISYTEHLKNFFKGRRN